MGLFSWFKKNKNNKVNIASPVDGEIVSTKQVKDETFSQDMIGEGFAIKPSNGNFVSPVDGEVTLMAETGHAYSIKTPDGIEVLVHIGLDTVNLNTKRQPNEPMKGFSQIAKVGDKVHVGDPIVTADLKLISNEKYETITPCIVIKNDITMNKTIHHTIESGTVTKGTIVLEV